MSASAVAEVARHCTYEDAEDSFVFAITRAVLAQLASLDAPHLDLIVAAYVFKLLSHIGYLPDCSSCVRSSFCWGVSPFLVPIAG